MGDLDRTDTATASVVSVATSGITTGTSGALASGNTQLLAMLSLTPSNILSNSQTSNTLTWSFNSGSEAFDYLAVGQSLTLTYTVRVTDSTGATVDKTIAVVINGSNDAPSGSATAQTAALVEAGGAANATAGVNSSSVTLTPTDADGTASFSLSALLATGMVTTTNSVGSSANTGSHTDGSPGNAYIQETPSGQTGTVTQWKFYKPHSTDGLWVTPVIYEKTADNVFVIRGIGRSRSASGPAGVYTFSFDLASGSDSFANSNYTYGHIDKNLNNSAGTIGQSSAGSISEGSTALSGGSGTWGFINTQNPSSVVGSNQSLGYRTQRNYASELILTSAATGGQGSLHGWSTTNSETFTKAGTYGTATFTLSTGEVAYTLDDSLAATQALTAGASVTDSFAIPVVDNPGLTGSATAVFTIQGSNDAPTLTAAAATASLVEASGANNASAGTASSSITLSKGDVDGTPSYDSTWLIANGWSTTNSGTTYSKSGSYGTATLTVATGVVSYSLDNNRDATEALKPTDTVSDSFLIRVNDGSGTASATAQVAAIFSITGADDLPRILASSTPVSLIEAGGVANGTAGVATSSVILTPSDDTITADAEFDIAWLTSDGWSDPDGLGATYQKTGTYGSALLTVNTGELV